MWRDGTEEVIMKHYVITRFNICGPSMDWTLKRLDAMEKWHIPSLKSQTNKKFKYVLIVDDQTGTKIIHRLDRAINGLNGLDYCYLFDKRKEKRPTQIEFKEHYTTTDDCSWIDELKEIIKNEGVVLTSRIDNDDFYIPDTVDRIQRSVDETKIPYILEPEFCFFVGKSLIDFGVTRYNALLATQKNQISPACTLVEHGKVAETCYCGPHNKLGKKYSFDVIRGINWGRFGNGGHEFDANWDTNKIGKPVWPFNFRNYDEFINDKNVLNVLNKRKRIIPV
jgi:hypothetical protein